MKPAIDWIKQFNTGTESARVFEGDIKAIQIDAYKQGVSECILEVEKLEFPLCDSLIISKLKALLNVKF